jgi:hypothetical protein
MSEIQAPVQAVRDGPEGIGGWLILPVIGLFVTPLRGLIQLKDYAGISDSFPLLSSAQQTFIIIEILLSVALTIVLPVVLLVLLFSRKRSFPKLYAFWGISIFVFIVADLMAVKALFGDMFAASGVELFEETTIQALIGGLVLAAVWVPYMLNSRRVRNTFTQ